MAKAEKGDLVKVESTALTAAAFGLAAEGFVEQVTVKIGDPDTREGATTFHVGQLIGPGADIDLADDAGTMPTWQVYPIVKDPNGKLRADETVIHNIIASSQLDMIYKRAAATKASTGKNVWVGVEFLEQGKNAKGQPLNKFRSSYKLVA